MSSLQEKSPAELSSLQENSPTESSSPIRTPTETKRTQHEWLLVTELPQQNQQTRSLVMYTSNDDMSGGRNHSSKDSTRATATNEQDAKAATTTVIRRTRQARNQQPRLNGSEQSGASAALRPDDTLFMDFDMFDDGQVEHKRRAETKKALKRRSKRSDKDKRNSET